MTQGVDPNDIYHNGAWYSRSGTGGLATYATDPSGNVTGLVTPQGTNNLLSFGNIATRCSLPTTVAAGQYYMNNRRRHFTATPITSLQLVIPNFYISQASGFEVGAGAATTVTASIEYPDGVYTQVKFSGNVSGTIPNLNYLVSDLTNVYIPAGASFYVRNWFYNPVAIVYDTSASTSLSINPNISKLPSVHSSNVLS